MQTDHESAHRWQVRPALPALKLTGAVAIVLGGLALGGGDPTRPLLAALAALALAVWGLRDLLVPLRLTADRAGITVVTGFARRRRLPWSAIERIRVQARPHRGLRTPLLEIDTGETLYLFSANDLGAPPDEVAAALAALRPDTD